MGNLETMNEKEGGQSTGLGEGISTNDGSDGGNNNANDNANDNLVLTANATNNRAIAAAILQSLAASVHARQSAPVFDRIEDDGLGTELLSFCEFHDAITVGRSCRRLKGLSDAALDGLIDATLAHLPLDCNWGNYGCVDIDATLKRGWSPEYRSRTALIETAIEYCHPQGDPFFGLDARLGADFDDDRARHLLRTRGVVDVKDFLNQEDEGFAWTDERGWNVNVTFQKMTHFDALKFVVETTSKINGMIGGYFDFVYDEDEYSLSGEDDDARDEGARRLRHCILCLLRKADPSSILFSQMEAEYRHEEFPAGRYKLQYCSQYQSTTI